MGKPVQESSVITARFPRRSSETSLARKPFQSTGELPRALLERLSEKLLLGIDRVTHRILARLELLADAASFVSTGLTMRKQLLVQVNQHFLIG